MALFMVKPWYKQDEPFEIVDWATGTDEEIAAMVRAADRGAINLADYWAIGDERQVQLSAMEASGSNDYGSWSVDESHVAQTVTLVLMDTGFYTLKTPVKDKNGNTRTVCSFVVGQKNTLANGTTKEGGYMNSAKTSSGSWNGCARRRWCNAAYRAAIPSTLRPVFKQFEVKTISNYSGSTMQTSNDYFALFAEREIFDLRKYSNQTEWNNLTQIQWYKTSSNRIKKTGNAGLDLSWWERSPYYSQSGYFCLVGSSGGTSCGGSAAGYGLAPFGVI